MPGPLVAFGYRLNARQDQGDWAGVLQIEQELDELLAARAGELTGMSGLIELLRGELVFSRAYLQRDAGLLKGLPMSADVDWYTPWLRPRCQALAAILAGDRRQGEAYVQQALQAADNCVVRSQGRSEALLAAHLRALA